MLDVILFLGQDSLRLFLRQIFLWFLGEGFPSVLLCQVSPRASEVFVVLPLFPSRLVFSSSKKALECVQYSSTHRRTLYYRPVRDMNR
jgi:hypothetical protein